MFSLFVSLHWPTNQMATVTHFSLVFIPTNSSQFLYTSAPRSYSWSYFLAIIFDCPAKKPHAFHSFFSNLHLIFFLHRSYCLLNLSQLEQFICCQPHSLSTTPLPAFCLSLFLSLSFHSLSFLFLWLGTKMRANHHQLVLQLIYSYCNRSFQGYFGISFPKSQIQCPARLNSIDEFLTGKLGLQIFDRSTRNGPLVRAPF